MSPSTDDSAGSTDFDDAERLLERLIEQDEQDEQDEPDEGRLYPFRLVQGEDDIRTDTSRDRGGWSAEELAMHLEAEP